MLSGEICNVNVNRNVDFCCRLSCELIKGTHYFRLSCKHVGWLTISKSQGLEIVYRAHSGAVKGVVGEGESVSWGGAQTKGEVHKRELTKKMFLHSDLLTSLSSSLVQLCLTRCEVME